MNTPRPQAQRLTPSQPEPEPAPPPSAPPPLLAAVAQWTGKEARALRIALRMPLAGFAHHINAGRSTVCDWETAGERLILTWGMQDALDHALSNAPNECKKRFALLCEGKANVSVTNSSQRNGNKDGDDTDRKDALEVIGGAGLAAALMPLEAVERIAADIGRQGRVATALVAAHEQWADMFADQHDIQRNDLLADPVARHADLLLGLLDRPMADRSRRRLEAITVATHVHAGLLAFNAGDRTAARRSFATAWSVADETGDDTLRARTLRVAQVLHSPIESGGRQGDARRAIKVVRRALYYARRADAATQANTHRRLGMLLAAAGDERAPSPKRLRCGQNWRIHPDSWTDPPVSQPTCAVVPTRPLDPRRGRCRRTGRRATRAGPPTGPAAGGGSG